ncbi:MAG: ribonuclease HI family protein [Phycisphaerae bacterium]
MTDSPLSVIMNIDGGARGNPGPAGCGVVLQEAQTGDVIHEAGYFIGKATNNVAEYTALVNGMKTARMLGVRDLVVLSDSQLLVRQMIGQYRVKNAGLKPLFEAAKDLEDQFEGVIYKHVRRELNKQADALANQAMNAKKNVEGAVDFERM